MIPEPIQKWHKIFKERDYAGLEEILADDVAFHSPVVHTPQEGKKITTAYLTAAFQLLGGEKANYIREVYGENDAILEFNTEAEGIIINGVDMIRWNDEGKIVDFKVMIRPLKAVNQVHQMMGTLLAQMSKKL